MLSGKRGFSLIEILVAICIVVIVATIAVPVYSSLQTSAQQTVANQIQSELNGAYAKWKDSGGMITNGSFPANADLLTILTSVGGAPMTIPAHDGYAGVQDAGASTNIRVGSLAGLPDLTVAGGTAVSGQATANCPVVAGNYTIYFNGASDCFYVASTGASGTLANGSFTTGDLTGWILDGSPLTTTVANNACTFWVGDQVGPELEGAGDYNLDSADIYQNVTVPANGTLAFVYAIPNGGAHASTFDVSFNGTTLFNPPVYDSLSANTMPPQMVFLDMSTYAGQTGVLKFSVNDTGGDDSFKLQLSNISLF